MQNASLKTLARGVALLTLAAFLAACSHNAARPDDEVQHFGMDWEHDGGEPLQAEPLLIQAIVLSPSQWPLETSVKRALSGSFTGILDGFHLTFQSSRIPSGVLEDLYDAGYVPVYLRVANASGRPAVFVPTNLTLRDHSGAELATVDPVQLPRLLPRIEWKRTGENVAMNALVVAVVLVAITDRKHLLGRALTNVGPFDLSGRHSDGPADTAGDVTGEGPVIGPERDAAVQRALLHSEVLPPYSAHEGIVFFSRSGSVLDWATADVAVR